MEVVYYSFDGKKFTSERDCLDYEKQTKSSPFYEVILAWFDGTKTDIPKDDESFLWLFKNTSFHFIPSSATHAIELLKKAGYKFELDKVTGIPRRTFGGREYPAMTEQTVYNLFKTFPMLEKIL